jgi:predicted phage terminase large subunit-like protein
MFGLTDSEVQALVSDGMTYDQVEAIDLEYHKRKCQDDLIYFAEWAVRVENDDNRLSACHRLLLSKLHRLLFDKGAKKNLMVFMPSGCGKSSILARIFVAWYLSKFPGKQVISASHCMDFATSENSTKCQGLLKEVSDWLGCAPKEENKIKWTTTPQKSVYRAAGVGSGIIGNRADLGLIDDPFGSSEDAESAATRNKVYRWYRQDFITRLKPGARKILMHQRQSLDDLAGRLLREEPSNWEILFLPAVFEGLNWDGSPMQTDELGRNIGDSIWPEYFTDEFLTERKAETTIYGWASMYQQRPQPLGGQKFTGSAKLIAFEHLPPLAKIVRAWDQAASFGKGDWTVGVKMGRGFNGLTYILDVIRFQEGPEGVRSRIVNTARKDGQQVIVGLAQDPGAAGKYVVADLSKALFGFDVRVSPETGKKTRRADPLAAQWNMGNCLMVRADWNKAYEDEFEVFPGGTHDDQVDASSRAFNELIYDEDEYEEPSWGDFNLVGR